MEKIKVIIDIEEYELLKSTKETVNESIKKGKFITITESDSKTHIGSLSKSKALKKLKSYYNKELREFKNIIISKNDIINNLKFDKRKYIAENYELYKKFRNLKSDYADIRLDKHSISKELREFKRAYREKVDIISEYKDKNIELSLKLNKYKYRIIILTVVFIISFIINFYLYSLI